MIDSNKTICIGLGNPGKKYSKTRHNVGFMFVDEMAKLLNVKFKREKKYRARIAESASFILVKPNTFMNDSGITLRKIMNDSEIDLKNVYIIHDDIYLPLGTIRIKQPGSGHGGHNGIKSIIRETGSRDPKRIKIGIDNGEDDYHLIDYVLGEFPDNELGIIEDLISLNSEKFILGDLDE